MTVTSSVDFGDVMDAINDLIVSLIPQGLEVARGQENRVGTPPGSDFVIMTLLDDSRQSTNWTSYSDVPGSGAKIIVQPTAVEVQLDVYGPMAYINKNIISAAVFDSYATQFIKSLGKDFQLLYSTDPRQMPWISSESQYVQRWTFSLFFQVNAKVNLPQDFADVNLGVQPLNVK